jgi:hypothetical protein
MGVGGGGVVKTKDSQRGFLKLSLVHGTYFCLFNIWPVSRGCHFSGQVTDGVTLSVVIKRSKVTFSPIPSN